MTQTQNAREVAWETLLCSDAAEGVVHVELNRPTKLNAMNAAFWREYRELFNLLAYDVECRAIVVSGRGRFFTAGLDVKDASTGDMLSAGKDVGRKALHTRDHVKEIQDAFTAMERCRQPVISAVHSGVVGGGIDLMCATDIRYCSADAWFTVKEVQIGLAADVGTLQRMPRIIGNDSLFRELAYTGRKMLAEEALRMGFVSKICSDRESVIKAALSTAQTIAAQSPLAVAGTKRNLLYARDHSVEDGLEYVATWNAAMLQSGDIFAAIKGNMLKKPAVFAKL